MGQVNYGAHRETMRQRLENATCDTQFAQLQRRVADALRAEHGLSRTGSMAAADTVLAVIASNGVAALDFLAATSAEAGTFLAI